MRRILDFLKSLFVWKLKKIELPEEALPPMAIRCAWCGESIFVGDPITLYSLPDRTDEVPKYAVPYQDGGHQCFVGCLRFNCAETGADRAGFWVSPGVVKRVTSPLELAMGLGAMVITPDLSEEEDHIILISTPESEN